MNTDTPTSSAPSSTPAPADSLLITNPLRAAIALSMGGRLAGYVEDGGKMLTFQVAGAPKDFIKQHETGQLMAETDAVERHFAYVSGIIREHSRNLEIRARANRASWGPASQRAVTK